MTLSEAILIGEDFQIWRRGAEHYEFGQDGWPPMRYSPEQYGEAIDILLHICREALKQ
jgi:hypothetical protein